MRTLASMWVASMWVASMWVGVVWISVAGCAAETEVEPTDPDSEVSLELGTGSWRFDPLEDGQRVELIRGAQGGWHFWLSLRVSGLEDMARGRMVLETQTADTTRPVERIEVDVRFDPPSLDGRRVMIGWPAIVADPSCLLGEPLLVSVELEPVGVAGANDPLRADRTIVLSGGTYPPLPCGS